MAQTSPGARSVSSFMGPAPPYTPSRLTRYPTARMAASPRSSPMCRRLTVVDISPTSVGAEDEEEKRENMQHPDWTQDTYVIEDLTQSLVSARNRLAARDVEHSHWEMEKAELLDTEDRLRDRVHGLETKNKILKHRYDAQTELFEAEREALYHQEQKLKSRIHSLYDALHRRPTRRPPLSNRLYSLESPPPSPSLRLPPRSERESDIVAALQRDFTSLSDSYRSLQDAYLLLQSQLADLQRINRGLQDENERLREATFVGGLEDHKGTQCLIEVGLEGPADDDLGGRFHSSTPARHPGSCGRRRRPAQGCIHSEVMSTPPCGETLAGLFDSDIAVGFASGHTLGDELGLVEDAGVIGRELELCDDVAAGDVDMVAEVVEVQVVDEDEDEADKVEHTVVEDDPINTTMVDLVKSQRPGLFCCHGTPRLILGGYLAVQRYWRKVEEDGEDPDEVVHSWREAHSKILCFWREVEEDGEDPHATCSRKEVEEDGEDPYAKSVCIRREVEEDGEDPRAEVVTSWREVDEDGEDPDEVVIFRGWVEDGEDPDDDDDNLYSWRSVHISFTFTLPIAFNSIGLRTLGQFGIHLKPALTTYGSDPHSYSHSYPSSQLSTTYLQWLPPLSSNRGRAVAPPIRARPRLSGSHSHG